MVWTVQFETGHTVQFEAEPSPADIEEVAAQFAPKNKGPTDSMGVDILKAVPRAIVKGGDTLRRGFNTIEALVYDAVLGAGAGDPIRAYADRNTEAVDEVVGQSNSIPGQIIEGAGTILPSAIAFGPLGAGVLALGAGTKVQKGLHDQDVDPTTAMKVAGVQTAANMAFMAVPALRPAMSILLNVGSGAGADEISRQLLSEYEAAQKAFSPKSEEYWVQRAIELLTGFIGADRTPRRDAKGEADRISDNLDKVAPKPTPETEDISFWKARAEQMQKEAQGYDPSKPMPVTPEGQGVTAHGADQLAIDQQLTRIRQQGGLDQRQARQALEAELNPIREPLDVGLQEVPPTDRGVRPTGTDGTPLRGMAEDVPTIDFPLRQEVLNQPEIKAATDAFRTEAQKLIEAGDQAGLDQLTRDFTAGMQRLGASKASDLYGRGLYEGGDQARYLETGIRRGGERNPALTYGEQKQLPLGGKQPSPDEFAAFKAAMRKKQGGAVHPDLLGVGAVSRLIDKFGDLGALTKFIGTFDAPSLRLTLGDLKANTNSRLVWMSPEEFLKLARVRPDTYDYNDVASKKRANIREGLKTKSGLADTEHTFAVPSLYVKKHFFNKGLAQVVGHDGRHRMDVFKELGIEKVPVYIADNSSTRHNYTQILGEGDSGYASTYPRSMDLPLDKLPGIKPKFIPKDQRGGAKGTWNPYQARKQLEETLRKGFQNAYQESKAADNVKITDETDAKTAVFEKVGFKGIDLVGEVEPHSPELVKRFMEIPDVGPATRFVAGALIKAELNNKNPVVLWAHRQLDNGAKRAAHIIRERIRPLEGQLYHRLRNKEDVLVMHEIFKKEIQNKQRFSPEQLKAAGVSDSIVEAYSKMREQFDFVLDLQNKARAEKGQKPIKAEEAYFSARWQGPWRFTIYEKNADGSRGAPVWQVAERSKKAARGALDWLKTHGEISDLVVVEPLQYHFGKGSGSQFKAQFADLLKVLPDNNPLVSEIRKILGDEAIFQTVNVAGQEKHFKRKTGVRGYVGDRPWADPVQDARAAFVQNIQYMKNAIEWAEYQKPMTEVRKLLADTEYAQAKPNTHKFVDQYAKSHAGLATTEAWDYFQNKLAKSLGRDVTALETLLGGSKSVFYIKVLGAFNIPFTLTQVIQPVFTAMQHGKLTSMEYAHDMGTSHLHAVSYGTLLWGQENIDFLRSNNISIPKALQAPLTGVWKDAAEYASASGMLDINPTSDIRELYRPYAMRAASDLGSISIIQSEKLARAMAFMGFVSHLEQSGKFGATPEDRSTMFRLAEEATQLSMVDYRPHEKAMVFSQMGLAGNALNTFMAFKLNFITQYAAYAADALGGKPKAFGLMTALMLALGGSTGLVGLEDADNLLDLLKNLYPGELPKEVLAFSIRGFMFDNWPELVSMGPVSVLTGTNLYTRFNQSEVVPIDPTGLEGTLSSVFPYVAENVKDVISIKDLLFSGDEAKKKTAKWQLLPAGLRGNYEQNTMVNEEGLAMKPKDPVTGYYRRNEREQGLRKRGFFSPEEAKTRDKSYREKKLSAMMDKEKQGIREKIVNNFILGKPQNLENDLKRYVELEGDVEALMSDRTFSRALLNANTTEKERIIIAAQSGRYPAISRMLRYLQ